MKRIKTVPMRRRRDLPPHKDDIKDSMFKGITLRNEFDTPKGEYYNLDFNQIKESVDLFKLCSEYVNDFEKSGNYFRGTCPLPSCSEEDKGKQFNFNPKKQVFYCFMCHKGGDALAFLALLKDISIVEAAKELETSNY